MKKALIIIIAVLACAASAAFGALAVFYAVPVKKDPGYSNIYEAGEISDAVDEVEKKFAEFKGCKLFALKYAGDEESARENESVENYDETIVIDSVFLSPLFGGGAWNAHSIYTWHFILARTYGGEWQIVNYGYA